MDNEAGYGVSKEQVEKRFAPRQFSDLEWEVLSYEIRELLEHTLDLELPEIVANLEELVNEYSERESE